MSAKPNILFVIARGEAVRNFLYSDTLPLLSAEANVYLLSVLHDDSFARQFGKYTAEIIPLQPYTENRVVRYLHDTILYAHYRWLWTEKVKNKWETLDYHATSHADKMRLRLWKAMIYSLANRPALQTLGRLDQTLSTTLRQTRQFDQLLTRVKPDLVFNTSHIHASLGDLPVRLAHRMGIPTSTFIFSWDNLTTRGRITVPYDHYLVWHEQMRRQLLRIYPHISSEHVTITGTPQFDYHYKPEYCLSRDEICQRMGLDPARPFILYTTGMDRDFPDEHRHVEKIIEMLDDPRLTPKPQLVVRTYAKGTSAEMKAIAARNIPDVVFPPILWEEKWLTPQQEDLAIYTSLLAHCAIGINPASTVSLELMMFDKPVINLGFDPPGSNLPHCYRWERHIQFDHFKEVAESSATCIATSVDDLRKIIVSEYCQPENKREARREFLRSVFGRYLDGKAGERVAQRLITLAKSAH